MHSQEVVAKAKGVEIGRKTIELADTLAEAIEIAGSEARVVELVNRMFVTDTRNSIARPSTGGIELRTRVELFHSMVENGVPEQQAKVIAKVSDEEIARVAVASKK